MNFEEIQKRSRELFRAEAADLLAELEESLLALEADPANMPLLNRAFRALHTLKGSGGTSGFQELSDFVHRVEDIFNAAREQRLQITSQMIDLSLSIADALSRYIAAPDAESAACLAGAQGTLDALNACASGGGKVTSTREAAQPSAATDDGGSAPTYRIDFKPNPNLFLTGGDPGIYLDDLRALGTCVVTGLTDGIPPLESMDPESSYLRWTIALSTKQEEDAIRSVFAFIEGECELSIDRVPAQIAPEQPAPGCWLIEFDATERTLASPGVLEALVRDLARFGKLEVLSEPAPVGGRPAPGLRRFQLTTSADEESIKGAFIFLDDAAPVLQRGCKAAQTRTLAGAPESSQPIAPRTKRAATQNEVLKVSAERMDRLVNLVGELVILRSQVKTACSAAPNLPDGLQGAAEALQSLSTEMRDVVLNIRMMPIEQTFAKFQRLVRDLARELGKKIQLTIEGGETEMDKAVLDALADPLVHLVRNSIDHGLETPAERVSAGKEETGTVTLRAEQRGDRVMVVVRDDGRGLDPDRIKAKAIARGLIPPGAAPSNSELFELIFLPGFSTAEAVSQVSGRGVGLDVVRRQVEQLRGRVEVRSERNAGVEFRLSLPLTLAIIDGLLVEVGGDRYILPLGIARQAIDLKQAARAAGNGRNLVDVRGEAVPYIRLRDVFGCDSGAPQTERVVLVDLEDSKLGLVVDRVLGNHQTVIKSLGWASKRVSVFSGATVLGDGRIALILDVAAVLAHTQATSTRPAGLEI